MQKTMALLATTAVLASLTAGAQAADLAVSRGYDAQPAQSYAAVDPFTGAYVGGTVGIVTSNEFNEGSNAAAIGGQVGYLQQFGAFVVGAEVEALYLNDLRYELGGGNGVSQNWSLAAKARAGVALDHTLLYGTLGYGVSSFEGYGGRTTSDDVKGGVVFGAGIEQAFTDSISARVEYLQTRYDGVSSDFGGPQTNDLVGHSVRLGLNYRF